MAVLRACLETGSEAVDKLRTSFFPLPFLPRLPSNLLPHLCSTLFHQVKSSQISFIAWKIRKIGEASADTAATETYYMKGYYNLEEEKMETDGPGSSKRWRR